MNGVVSLDDDPSVFAYRPGDWVAPRRGDGAPNRDAKGVIKSGLRASAPNGGISSARYEIEQPDGSRVVEEEGNLIRLLNNEQIRERIRERFLTGALPRTLPPPPEGTLEGHETIEINGGRRQPCSACDLIIPADENGSLEFYYPTGLKIRLHAACHSLWDEERVRPALRKRRTS